MRNRAVREPPPFSSTWAPWLIGDIEADIALETVRFLYDGDRVNDSDTALTLGMEDGAVIECGISPFFFLSLFCRLVV